MLVNLITNSIQAMSGKGKVWVEAAARRRAPPRCASATPVPAFRRRFATRVFEALFTTKAKGSGLGLALCRRIVEAHGGSIVVEPTSEGASFLITIPDVIAA